MKKKKKHLVFIYLDCNPEINSMENTRAQPESRFMQVRKTYRYGGTYSFEPLRPLLARITSTLFLSCLLQSTELVGLFFKINSWEMREKVALW
jgi:hypothetical protein